MSNVINFQENLELSNLEWNDLSDFEQGYFECALAISLSTEVCSARENALDEDEAEEKLNELFNFYNLSLQAKKSMLKACRNFETSFSSLLDLTDKNQSGFDLYFDANGCGTGFADRDTPPITRAALEREARKVMTSSLYSGDDERLYVFENS